jgi:hypothetical protein
VLKKVDEFKEALTRVSLLWLTSIGSVRYVTIELGDECVVSRLGDIRDEN